MENIMIKTKNGLNIKPKEAVDAIISYLESDRFNYNTIAKILEELKDEDFKAIINEMASDRYGVFQPRAFCSFIQELEKTDVITKDRLDFVKNTDKYKLCERENLLEYDNSNKILGFKQKTKEENNINNISLDVLVEANRAEDKSFGGWAWVDIVSVLTIPTLITPAALIGAKCYFGNKAYNKVIDKYSEKIAISEKKGSQKRAVTAS